MARQPNGSVYVCTGVIFLTEVVYTTSECQNERGQNTHGQGERVKIPLLPKNVGKRVLTTRDHNRITKVHDIIFLMFPNQKLHINSTQIEIAFITHDPRHDN